MTPQALIERAHAYCQRTGCAFSTVSRKLLGGGTDLGRIEDGNRSIRYDTLVSAFERMASLEADADRRDAA